MQATGAESQNRPRASFSMRFKSLVANQSAQRSNKREKIKRGASKHPQHPHPACCLGEDSIKMSLGPSRNRMAILWNLNLSELFQSTLFRSKNSPRTDWLNLVICPVTRIKMGRHRGHPSLNKTIPRNAILLFRFFPIARKCCSQGPGK
jgi:hypothetical protein